MGAKHYSELVAWQCGNELKRAVYEITERPEVARDREYCWQIRGSSASAPANIAEGFGRFSHRDFARFVRQALTSIDETENHIDDGVDRGLFDAATQLHLQDVRRHARATTLGLLRYLQRTPDPRR